MKKDINLLYVDDEPVNLQLFEIVFKNSFQILTAVSGPVALERINQYPNLSVIITDMKMPKMNGVEFIRQVKKILPDIPCFILTGFDMNDEIHEAIQNGFVKKCFKKPLNKEEIIETINKAVK